MRRIALAVLSTLAIVSCTSTPQPTASQPLSTSTPPPAAATASPPTVPSASRAAVVTTTPAGASPAASTYTYAYDGIAWTRIDDSVLPDLGGDPSVQQTGGRFLVNTEADGSGYLLSSEDGLNWSNLGPVVTQPDTACCFFQAPSMLLALGGRGAGNKQETGIWHSADGGHTWSFTNEPSFTSRRCGSYVEEIASDGSDLIATGSGVWHSTDGGNSWSCLGPNPHYGITYGHGTFVAVGYADSNAEPQRFWRSTDGVNWQQVQKAPFNTEIPVTIGTGFVTIAGAEGPAGPPTHLLTSADGASWVEQPYPFGDADLYLAGSDGDRAIAIQEEYSTDPDQAGPGAVWISSSDGINWSKYQVPPRTGDEAEEVALLGDVIVVSGTSAASGGVDGVLWSGRLP